MGIAIDKKKVLLESIANILKVLVQSYNNKNDYKLISKIEGLKYITRQFQFDIYQNVVDSNNDLFECISADTIVNGLNNSYDNGDTTANDENLVVQSTKIFVDCLKDGRSAGYVW